MPTVLSNGKMLIQLGMATHLLAELILKSNTWQEDDIYDHKKDIQRAYAQLIDTIDPYGRDDALDADIMSENVANNT